MLITLACLQARKPVLYVGGGCLDASRELREFVQKTGIPVASTLMGLGVFPDSDDLALQVCQLPPACLLCHLPSASLLCYLSLRCIRGFQVLFPACLLQGFRGVCGEALLESPYPLLWRLSMHVPHPLLAVISSCLLAPNATVCDALLVHYFQMFLP